MNEQTPCDVPGTSDHAWDVEQTRRDAEIDAACPEYDAVDVLRERRAAHQMRRAQSRARAIAAEHPSAQHLSTGVTGRTVAADPVDIHFAAPSTHEVEQCDPGVSPLPGHLLRTPPPKGHQI